MADTWQAISGYASNNYSDTMVFEVDGATKKLQKISGQTLIAGEKNSQYIRFMMPRYWDGIDVSEKTISIIYGLAGQYYGETAAISAERTDDSLRFGWVVPEEACCIAGTLLFVLVIKDSTYVLKSQITEVPVLKSINLDDVIPEPTKETWYADFQVRVERTLSAAENAVEVAQNTLEQARSLIGSPLVANTAADMADTSRIYVYTGSETGYTNGHWYYHNGSAWTDGGVYNAVAVDTDTTLSIAGKAADAKKTGDEIEQIKEDFTDMVNSVYVTDSASGSVAHFVDGADNVPMKSVKVNIAPVQSGSGDPSPSNVRPISGWDSVKVTRSGKNLLQCPTSGGRTNSGITWTYNSDGSVTASGTATGNSWSYANPSTVTLPPGTYTVSVTSPFGMVVQNLTDGGYIHNGGYSQVTFTLNKLTRVGVHARVASRTTINATTGMQIEVGTEATEYEPYNGNEYNISLASAGTVYGGTLDAVSGVLTVDKGFVTLDGTQTIANRNWRATSNSVGWLYPYSVTQNVVPNSSTEVPDVISNRVKTASYSAACNGTENNCVSFVYDTSKTYGLAVRYDNTLLTTDAAINAFLAENPIQVVYSLATPLTYQLTATEIKSLLGINNVWSDAGDMDVEYRANTKLYIKRLTDSDTDMIADSNIVSGQYFMVGNNLYKATANIASGSAVIVGTNAIRKSLSEALNEINA